MCQCRCRCRNSTQEQAALAGAYFGEIFDTPGLALTLNLTPSSEKSIWEKYYKNQSNEQVQRFAHQLPKPKYDI